MKKQIALGIAAAVLGVSGVAGALVSVDQLTSAANSESSITAATDQLAANCWMVTGSASDAGCDTSVAGLGIPGLPEIPNLTDGVDIPDATGLLAMATDALGSAGSAVPVGSLASDAQALATGAVSACNLPVSLPVKVIPSGIFSAGLTLFDMAQNLAMNDLGAASLASPVDLPVGVPADDLINTVERQTGCLASQAGGGLPIPAACTGNVGAPSAVTGVVPSEISGLLGTVAQQLAGITGQGINVTGSGNLGVNCDLNKVVEETPLGSVTSAVAPLVATVTDNVPSVGSVTGTAGSVGSVAGTATGAVTDAVGSVAGVTDTVGGVLNTVTGAVDGLLGGSLPVDVPPLPLPTSTPTCSASASGSLGGLLGSLTTTITGGCK